MSSAGGMGIGMWIVMAVLLAAVWLLVVLILQAVTGGRHPGAVSSGTDPVRSLEEALASGAITVDEYERRRAKLSPRW